MNVHGVDTLLHENDENYVKYTRLLAKAVADGRLDGKRCSVCGMRWKTEAESQNCCVQVDKSA